jgi:hypothetical protein
MWSEMCVVKDWTSRHTHNKAQLRDSITVGDTNAWLDLRIKKGQVEEALE